MIDESVFKSEWQILCERFNRQPSRILAVRYYQSLSGRMSTIEFRAACKRIFDSHEFFPRPDDFFEVVKGDVAGEALGQWELCERVMAGDVHVLGRMTEEGQRVVRLLGGVHRLGQTPLDSLPFVRKEFLGLYSQAAEIEARERNAIGPMTTEGRKLIEDLKPELKRIPSGRKAG